MSDDGFAEGQQAQKAAFSAANAGGTPTQGGISGFIGAPSAPLGGSPSVVGAVQGGLGQTDGANTSTGNTGPAAAPAATTAAAANANAPKTASQKAGGALADLGKGLMTQSQKGAQMFNGIFHPEQTQVAPEKVGGASSISVAPVQAPAPVMAPPVQAPTVMSDIRQKTNITDGRAALQAFMNSLNRRR